MKAPRRPLIHLAFISALFGGAGVGHFLSPEPFVRIVPPMLPAPEALVYISGAFEILGAIGILVPRTRSFAAWGLIALLFAVFPANIYMAVAGIYLEGMPEQPALLWGRLPVQFLLMGWIVFAAQLRPEPAGR